MPAEGSLYKTNTSNMMNITLSVKSWTSKYEDRSSPLSCNQRHAQIRVPTPHQRRLQSSNGYGCQHFHKSIFHFRSLCTIGILFTTSPSDKNDRVRKYPAVHTCRQEHSLLMSVQATAVDLWVQASGRQDIAHKALPPLFFAWHMSASRSAEPSFNAPYFM